LLWIAALLAGLAPAALALAGQLVWPPRLEHGLALALCMAAAGGLVRAALARERWSQAEVARDVGAGLRRLLVATAALSLCSAAPGSRTVAVAILAGYPLAHGLRRVFPPS
jgi:hypothetical protein